MRYLRLPAGDKQRDPSVSPAQVSLRAVFEHAATGMAMIGLDTGYLKVNQALARTLGYPTQELERMFIADIVSTEHSDRLRQVFAHMMADELENDAIEVRARHKDGATLWLATTSSLVRDAAGMAMYFVMTYDDITPRKHALHELELERQRLRLAQQIAHVGNFERALSGDTLWSSEEQNRIFGLAADQRGLRFEEFLACVLPEDRPMVRAALTALSSGRYDDTLELDYRIRRADGEVRNLHERVELIRDGTGAPSGLNGVTQDVTDRVSAERATVRSERLWREMLNGMDGSVCVLDRRGVVIAANRACEEFFRRDRSPQSRSLVTAHVDFIRACSQFSEDPSAHELMQGVREVLSGEKQRVTLEYLSVHSNARRWSLVHIVGVPGDDGSRALISIDNITPLKRTQQILAVEKRVLEMLSSDASLEATLAALCSGLESISDGGQYGVWLTTSDGQQMRKGAAPSLPAEYLTTIDAISPTKSDPNCAEAMRSGKAVYTDSIVDDPIWRTVRDLALSHNLRACWTAPLDDHAGKILGTISVYFPAQRCPKGAEAELFDRAIHLTSMVLYRTRAKDQARLMAQVFSTTQDGIMVTDANNTILLVNRAFAEITGYAADVATGAKPQWVATGSRDPSFLVPMREALRKDGQWRGEIWDTRKNGERYWAHLSYSAVKDGRGKTTHYVATFSDITTRKNQEQALRSSESMLRLITDNVPALIGYFDRDAMCQFANAGLVQFLDASRYGTSVRSLRDLVGDDLYLDLERDLEKVLTGVPTHCEARMHTGNVARYFDIDLVPNMGSQMHVDGFYLLANDVTEKKGAEEQIRLMNINLENRVEARTRQLAAANRELEAFSYSVSHDLRAPLRTIEGFSRIISSRYSESLDASGQDYLNRISRATMRMGELIDDMLKLSQISRSEVNKRSVDLSTMANEVFEELLDQHKRNIEFRVAPDMCIDADPRLLRIVLENLIGNACKFTAKVEQPRITLSPANVGSGGSFVIEDNGAGFDMRYAEKLFGVFQRLHRESEFEGTGIGLAIVQRIANLHGWVLEGTGEVGKGARFAVTTQT